MKLATYLKRKKLSQREFARMCKISHTSISKYLNGTRIPNSSNTKKIVKYTKGEVKVTDLWS